MKVGESIELPSCMANMQGLFSVEYPIQHLPIVISRGWRISEIHYHLVLLR
jgi:hypothetical protein